MKPYPRRVRYGLLLDFYRECIFIGVSGKFLRFYASGFETNWEVYWFQHGRASVNACVRPLVQIMVLNLNVWVPPLKYTTLFF